MAMLRIDWYWINCAICFVGHHESMLVNIILMVYIKNKRMLHNLPIRLIHTFGFLISLLVLDKLSYATFGVLHIVVVSCVSESLLEIWPLTQQVGNTTNNTYAYWVAHRGQSKIAITVNIGISLLFINSLMVLVRNYKRDRLCFAIRHIWIMNRWLSI